jgi:hypothetical protein
MTIFPGQLASMKEGRIGSLAKLVQPTFQTFGTETLRPKS